MLIYDVEICNAVPPRGGRLLEGVRYCAGWDDFPGMGVACVCVYDFIRDCPRVFLQDNLADFVELADRHECLVGYNNMRFDNQVLRATLQAAGLPPLPEDRSYDLLREIWRSAGLSDVFHPATHGGFGLDAVCKANFNYAAKTGNGSDAPIWYQRGEIGKLVDYCLADVFLTKRLLDRVLRCGQLRDPKTGQWLSIRKP